MARIEFKAKPQTVYNMDESVAYICIKVPTLTRNHCDMAAFRSHPKYSSYANSDLFPAILNKIKREILGDYIKLNAVPEGVMIDNSGYLAKVSVDV
jgi:hypothetical protein